MEINVTSCRFFMSVFSKTPRSHRLYLGVGLGFNGSTLEQRAWGTSRVGSLAYFSTYSTIRVPFTSRLRITVEMPPCVTFPLPSRTPMVQNDRVIVKQW